MHTRSVVIYSDMYMDGYEQFRVKVLWNYLNVNELVIFYAPYYLYNFCFFKKMVLGNARIYSYNAYT